MEQCTPPSDFNRFCSGHMGRLVKWNALCRLVGSDKSPNELDVVDLPPLLTTTVVPVYPVVKLCVEMRLQMLGSATDDGLEGCVQ